VGPVGGPTGGGQAREDAWPVNVNLSPQIKSGAQRGRRIGAPYQIRRPKSVVIFSHSPNSLPAPWQLPWLLPARSPGSSRKRLRSGGKAALPTALAVGAPRPRRGPRGNIGITGNTPKSSAISAERGRFPSST
jgi:hypothetical protein